MLYPDGGGDGTPFKCDLESYCAGCTCACCTWKPPLKARLLFSSGLMAAGDDEPDGCCIRAWRRRTSFGSMSPPCGGFTVAITRGHAVRVPDGAGLRWDPCLHHGGPTMKPEKCKAFVMTCSASEGAFGATRKQSSICQSFYKRALVVCIVPLLVRVTLCSNSTTRRQVLLF